MDAKWMRVAMAECLSDKYERFETAEFLATYSDYTARQLHHSIKRDKRCAEPLMDIASAAMALEITERKIDFTEIKYSKRLDGNSGKVREIGVECIKQQIYDYAAVNALMELLERKIGKYQCASIPGRGQIYGKKAIEKWVRDKL